MPGIASSFRLLAFHYQILSIQYFLCAAISRFFCSSFYGFCLYVRLRPSNVSSPGHQIKKITPLQSKWIMPLSAGDSVASKICSASINARLHLQPQINTGRHGVIHCSVSSAIKSYHLYEFIIKVRIVWHSTWVELRLKNAGRTTNRWYRRPDIFRKCWPITSKAR